MYIKCILNVVDCYAYVASLCCLGCRRLYHDGGTLSLLANYCFIGYSALFLCYLEVWSVHCSAIPFFLYFSSVSKWKIYNFYCQMFFRGKTCKYVKTGSSPSFFFVYITLDAYWVAAIAMRGGVVPDRMPSRKFFFFLWTLCWSFLWLVKMQLNRLMNTLLECAVVLKDENVHIPHAFT